MAFLGYGTDGFCFVAGAGGGRGRLRGRAGFALRHGSGYQVDSGIKGFMNVHV